MSISLSETSSLVLICDNNTNYQTPKPKEFLSQLDLSLGQKLYDSMSQFKPYIDEIIRNRKFFIHQTIRNFINQHSTAQVLVLACGWDPILVKMSEEFPQNLFMGVDSESVETQKRLVKQLMPQARIVYDQVDITQVSELLSTMKQRNWQPDQPTCIVAEGIIYYITPEAFWPILKALKNEISADTIICGDYLLDWNKQSISELDKKVGSGVFSIIQDTCNQEYYTYTDAAIQSRIQNLGDLHLETFPQNNIQVQRTKSDQPWGDKQGPIRLFSAKQH